LFSLSSLLAAALMFIITIVMNLTMTTLCSTTKSECDVQTNTP
jgi:hypothetical protein